MNHQFTIKAGEALNRGQQLASASGHGAYTPLHLLEALLGETDGGVVVPLLEKAGVRLDHLRRVVQSELDRLPKVSGADLQGDPRLREVLDAARKEADRLKDQYVSTEHLLLALATVESLARDALALVGAERDALLAALQEVRGGATVNSENPEDHLSGPRALRAGPGRLGPARQDRSGDRARRRDPPLHAGAQPAAPRTTPC
jgi:ATP-dependent Clp protease ATP-binding subunit ClpB